MMFADLDAAPAAAFKWGYFILSSLVGLAGICVGIYGTMRKQKLEIDKQPVDVRKAGKRYNHDLTEERHLEVTRRLDQHDQEIQNLNDALEGKLSTMGKTINEMPATIVALLRNTKARFD